MLKNRLFTLLCRIYDLNVSLNYFFFIILLFGLMAFSELHCMGLGITFTLHSNDAKM